MVAFNVVEHFRHQNELRPYRRELAAEIGQDFALRLLPALLDLPLPLNGSDGAPDDLNAALQQLSHVTLAGAAGSGRRLALQQFAYRWAMNEKAPAPIPALVSLPRLDDDHLTPDALIAAWTQPTAQMTEPKPQRSGLSRLRLSGARQAPAERHPRRLLLIHGWEELPYKRRVAWRVALLDAPHRWPEVCLAVALPKDEPTWPGFAPFMIAPPTPALLASWIERLAPAEHRAMLLDALDPAGDLHMLGERLFEVALLAWLAPRAGLPATRAELYERVLAHLLDMSPIRPARTTVIAELRLLAAYGEWPSFTIPGLLEPRDGGTPRFTHLQARRYLAAGQLVEEGRYDLLHSLEQSERDELALLIATMLADPTPLYAALWGSGHPQAADVLTLGRCLAERAPSSPSWTLRVIGALAMLARSGPPEQRTIAHTLLAAAMPILDAILPALVSIGESLEPFLLRLFESLPADLVAPRMALLAYDGATPERLAWELADQLLAQPAEEDRFPPADRAALARWAYIQAVRGPHTRQCLTPALAMRALPTLVGAAAGDERRQRAAGALLDDPALPIATHLAALELLAGNQHPAAFAAIQRALHDQSSEIRQRAIVALASHDSERVYTTLRHIALDANAPWDTRLNAIQRLGDYLALGADTLLERCASTPALPLYARMEAVMALGRQPGGMARLVAIAGDANCHPEVRAVAARAIGTASYHDALDHLLRLLTRPTTPALLAEAICAGLGALGAGHPQRAGVRDVLLHTIETATTDVALTLAAVHALGALGDQEAIETLSDLLGAGALERLQRGPHQHLLQQAAETCLDAPSIPQEMSLRLASACADGATPAARPTTLAEFLISEANLLRAAAAASLAAIGGNRARAALLNALTSGAVGGAAEALIAALAATEGDASAEMLGYLLVTTETNPLTRWLAVPRLADHPAGVEVMRRVLAHGNVDTFTRGALAEALGQRGDTSAVPLLLQLADDQNAEAHLRSQAVLALGLLDQPTTEPALIRLVCNQAEDNVLRGLAAENLPSALSDQSRRLLRDMLRRERVPAPIAASTLLALKRLRDHEALPLMLRYGQDASAEVAQAAIGALAELGDASVTPDLVRITQNPNVDRAVRLEAVGALLRLGGTEFRPLLQTYLDQGPLPLRLQALEHLITTGDAPAELLAILADRTLPLLLRLRVLECMRDDPRATTPLLGILQNSADDPHIRCLAAEALGRTRQAAALTVLIALAERADTASSVQLRCIKAISAIGGTESWLALSNLAENSARSPIIRYWAILALRHFG